MSDNITNAVADHGITTQSNSTEEIMQESTRPSSSTRTGAERHADGYFRELFGYRPITFEALPKHANRDNTPLKLKASVRPIEEYKKANLARMQADQRDHLWKDVCKGILIDYWTFGELYDIDVIEKIVRKELKPRGLTDHAYALLKLTYHRHVPIKIDQHVTPNDAIMLSVGKLELHPLCKKFPAYSKEDFADVRADIKKNNQIDPIVLFDGQILDGKHRYEICIELDIEPKIINFEDMVFNEDTCYEGSPLDYVVSKNLLRRHLSISQRAAIAADIANMRQGERTDLEPCSNSGKVTQSEAAKTMRVSRNSVQAAVKIKEINPEVFEKVRQGEMSLNAALKKTALIKPIPKPNSASEPHEQDIDTPTINEIVNADDAISEIRTNVQNAVNAFMELPQWSDQAATVDDMLKILRDNFADGVEEIDVLLIKLGFSTDESELKKTD